MSSLWGGAPSRSPDRLLGLEEQVAVHVSIGGNEDDAGSETIDQEIIGYWMRVTFESFCAALQDLRVLAEFFFESQLGAQINCQDVHDLLSLLRPLLCLYLLGFGPAQRPHEGRSVMMILCLIFKQQRRSVIMTLCLFFKQGSR